MVAGESGATCEHVTARSRQRRYIMNLAPPQLCLLARDQSQGGVHPYLRSSVGLDIEGEAQSISRVLDCR